jgi:hypothetical protein
MGPSLWLATFKEIVSGDRGVCFTLPLFPTRAIFHIGFVRFEEFPNCQSYSVGWFSSVALSE